MSQNTDLVNKLIRGWEAKDAEAILSCFTDDAVYINVPMDPPNVGKAMIRAVVDQFVGMAQEVQFVIHHSCENPQTGVVMNERTDRFLMNGKWIEIAVMGVFEVRDGRIAKWRDYFDLGQYTRQLG